MTRIAIGSLLAAALLVFIIKMFTNKEVSFWKALAASLASQFVMLLIFAFGLSKLESRNAILASWVVCNLVLTGVIVRVLCSASFPRVVAIVLTHSAAYVLLYTGLNAVLRAGV